MNSQNDTTPTTLVKLPALTWQAQVAECQRASNYTGQGHSVETAKRIERERDAENLAEMLAFLDADTVTCDGCGETVNLDDARVSYDLPGEDDGNLYFCPTCDGAA